MRRTNTRKRNKFNFNNLNKRALILIGILSIFIIILITILSYFLKNAIIKNNFEKDYSKAAYLNEEPVFSLDKIVLFSSATVKTNELKNSVWNLDISQFSDICIYLNNIENNNNSKNIVRELYIDNINISKTESGTPYLYQKTIQDFGKCTFEQDKIISDRIDFNILSTDSTANYSNNEIFDNLSNPIVLGYYNQNIKTNFFNANSQVDYSGKILKEAKIPQTSIECNISFDIHIKNELNEEYICNVNFDIPFESDKSSVYENGHITKELGNLSNYKFLRLK